jgi:hypothetical protein
MTTCSQHHTKSGKMKSFPIKFGMRQGVTTLCSLTQYSTGIISQIKKTGERNKMDSNRKGRTQIISICKWYNLIIPKRP